MRVTGVVCLTVFSTALGCAGAASAEPVPAPSRARVVASAVGAEQSWTQLQADRRARSATARPDSDTFSVAGPRAALLERVRSQVPRVGPAPTASATTAIDGPITVQHGTSVRSIDPVTSATSTQRLPAGASLPTWGPAGDRLVALLGGASPELVMTDEDGASNRQYYGSDGGIPRPRVPLAWSPFGDSATMATTSHAGLNYGVNPSSHGWYFHTGAHVPEVSPTVNGYGDLIVTKWSEPAADPSLPRRHGLTVTRGSYPDGRQPSGPTVDISTGPYTDFGAPAVGLAPGGSVLDRSDEYLALPVRLPAAAGGAGLYIDHADGRGLVRVASLGAVCPAPQVAFSPSHRSVAYLEAAGPAGAECSRTRLWVMDADGARYGSRPARLVADSGAGGPFTSMSWRARTPAPFAGRIGGIDRVATGIASSRVLFTEGAARTAVIAGSAGLPRRPGGDTAGRSARRPAAPDQGQRPSRAGSPRSSIRAVQPGATVYLVGGPAVLGSAVEKAVEPPRVSVWCGWPASTGSRRPCGSPVDLDANDPRPETCPNSPVLMADGTGFADALVAGPAASHWFGTVVLSNGVTTACLDEGLPEGGDGSKSRPYDRWLNAVGGAAVKAVESDALTRGKVQLGRRRRPLPDRRVRRAHVLLRTFGGRHG